MRVLFLFIVGGVLAASAAPRIVGQQIGGVPNSATIDFSRLKNIPDTDKPITIQVEVTDSSGTIFRTLNTVYAPSENTPASAANLFEEGLKNLDWVVKMDGDFKVTVYQRNIVEKNVIYYRPITSIRFVGLVGGSERMPRITTTGKVKVIVN